MSSERHTRHNQRAPAGWPREWRVCRVPKVPFETLNVLKVPFRTTQTLHSRPLRDRPRSGLHPPHLRPPELTNNIVERPEGALRGMPDVPRVPRRVLRARRKSPGRRLCRSIFSGRRLSRPRLEPKRTPYLRLTSSSPLRRPCGARLHTRHIRELSPLRRGNCARLGAQSFLPFAG